MKLSIRKLTTKEELLEAQKVIAISFLNPWEEEEAIREAENPSGEVWGAFIGNRMVAAATTLRHEMTFEGGVFPCGEIHMLGTLPEARGSGAAGKLVGEILQDYRLRGDLFTFLIPFSFAFYRRYGFELASEMLLLEADIFQFASFSGSLIPKQVACQEEADEAREPYRKFALAYNLALLKGEEAWTLGENGEVGKRDWQYMDKQSYSYLFYDENVEARAYLSFVFVPGLDGPFTGKMAVTELFFDSPRALRSVFAFMYGMRAKIRKVSLCLPRDLDVSYLLPEPDKAERRLDGHLMVRALDVSRVLSSLRMPKGEGEYSLRVVDEFFSENTGTYTVSFAEGRVREVRKGEEEADLTVTEETFVMLSTGFIDLAGALYREGSCLAGKEEVLRQVFGRKPVLLC